MLLRCCVDLVPCSIALEATDRHQQRACLASSLADDASRRASGVSLGATRAETRSGSGAREPAVTTQSTTGFGTLLRQHRLAAGLTQEALAERAGLSVYGIQKLEAGTTHPYRDTAQRLALALELTPDAAEQFNTTCHLP